MTGVYQGVERRDKGELGYLRGEKGWGVVGCYCMLLLIFLAAAVGSSLSFALCLCLGRGGGLGSYSSLHFTPQQSSFPHPPSPLIRITLISFFYPLYFPSPSFVINFLYNSCIRMYVCLFCTSLLVSSSNFITFTRITYIICLSN